MQGQKSFINIQKVRISFQVPLSFGWVVFGLKAQKITECKVQTVIFCVIYYSIVIGVFHALFIEKGARSVSHTNTLTLSPALRPEIARGSASVTTPSTG